ncbi:MAG: esterase, depolymerase family [Phenylobacterium sp.]|jgi:poly(hydroxyalkanoate) depolymerase family esterase|nr:esterase, depolymerase family [Phenylobacterium sp.]
MRGLGETTAGLARLRKAMNRQSNRGDDAGLSEVRGFGFNPGGLRMLAYVPEGLAPDAALVVVLHGCTQRAGSHARAAGWLALADRLGFAVLAPEQDSANNPNRCFNWFEPGDIARDAGEAASIHAMIQHMVRAHALDATRVFVTGLSAGGAMTSVLLAAYPETFAAGAVVAGLPFGVAGNVQEAFAAMHGGARLGSAELGALVARAAPAPRRWPRLAIWHGQADGTVASANAPALARQWAAVHGLAEQPDEVRARHGWARSVWRASDGEALIELNLLAGLGHGTPLAAGGDDPIGEVAPFMLEAGVSSSLEIARFWGLAPPEPASQGETWSASGDVPEQPGTHVRLGESVMASVAPHVSDDVQKVIAKALASAGLMG